MLFTVVRDGLRETLEFTETFLQGICRSFHNIFLIYSTRNVLLAFECISNDENIQKIKNKKCIKKVKVFWRQELQKSKVMMIERCDAN